LTAEIEMKDSSRNVDDDIDDDEILNRIIREPNTTDITFEGIQTKGLIDTGSQISTITEDFYNSLQNKPELRLMDDFQLGIRWRLTSITWY